MTSAWKTATLGTTLAATLVLGGSAAARADDNRGSLKCVMESCAPQANCHAISLDGNMFDPSPGNEYLIGLTDNWDATDTGFKLDGARYSGQSAMSRTVVTIVVNTSTHDMKVSIRAQSAGGSPTQLTASGHCDLVKTTPYNF